MVHIAWCMNTRILHDGSYARDKEIRETLVYRILMFTMFKWCLGSQKPTFTLPPPGRHIIQPGHVVDVPEFHAGFNMS